MTGDVHSLAVANVGKLSLSTAGAVLDRASHLAAYVPRQAQVA